MIKFIMEELEDLYSLKHITRYNNIPRIKEESVAEHSYFVALITARLHNYYKFDLKRALLMSIVHDIFEIYISDIPRNVKIKYPKLSITMKDIEEDCINEKYPEYKLLIMDFNKGLTMESMIVKLADNLSVVQYAETEVKLGSTHYMPEVVKLAKESIKKLEKKLKKYERNKKVYGEI